MIFACAVLCMQLCWENPTQTIEGEPLEALQSINFYFGTEPGNYDYRVSTVPTTSPGAESCTNIKVAPGDYYVAATVTDLDGVESELSNEIQATEERGLPTPGGGRLQTPSGGRIITDG